MYVLSSFNFSWLTLKKPFKSPLNTSVPDVPETIPFHLSLLSRTSLPPFKSTVEPSSIFTITSDSTALPEINDNVFDSMFNVPASAFKTPTEAEPE